MTKYKRRCLDAKQMQVGSIDTETMYNKDKLAKNTTK